MFERDKDDLRALGVPIEVGGSTRSSTTSRATASRATRSSCPRSPSSADEAAVVGLAARVWQQAGLAAATSDAAAQAQRRRASRSTVRRSTSSSPSWRPTSRRSTLLGGGLRPDAASVRLPRPGEAAPRRRHLQPWGIVSLPSGAGTSSGTTSTATRAAVPAVPGHRRRAHGRPGRAVRRTAEGTDLRERGRPAWRRPRRRARPSLLVRAGPGTASGGARHGRGRRVGPDDPHVGGTASSWTARRAGLVDEVLVPRPRRRGAGARGPARRRRRAAAQAVAGMTHDAPRRVPATRSTGCWPWCRTCRPATGPVAEAAADVRRRPPQVLGDINVLLFCGLPGGLHGRPHRGRLRRASRARTSSGSRTPTTWPGRCG